MRRLAVPETRVLLVDDHAMLRSGLKLLLQRQAGTAVIGEASDGLEAIRLADELKPDVILLDLTMPGMGGLEALAILRRVSPQSRILVLTMHEDESYLRQVLKAGAAGYILKRAADAELIAAVQAVTRGEVYVHPAMTHALLGDLVPDAGRRPSPGGPDDWHSLSEREREVLRLVALGHTNTEIAERLALSVKTIETYRARGLEKLDLRSRAALVKYALERGLLDE
jgi:two-component system, NarL family, response regulator NreC